MTLEQDLLDKHHEGNRILQQLAGASAETTTNAATNLTSERRKHTLEVTSGHQ